MAASLHSATHSSGLEDSSAFYAKAALEESYQETMAKFRAKIGSKSYFEAECVLTELAKLIAQISSTTGQDLRPFDCILESLFTDKEEDRLKKGAMLAQMLQNHSLSTQTSRVFHAACLFGLKKTRDADALIKELKCCKMEQPYEDFVFSTLDGYKTLALVDNPHSFDGEIPLVFKYGEILDLFEAVYLKMKSLPTQQGPSLSDLSNKA